MEGEDEESNDDRALNKKPVWMRIIVVISGALMNLLLGIVITFIIVLNAEALPSQVIAEFDENALSSQSGLQAGDKIIEINNKKVNIYTDIAAGLSQAYNENSVDIVVERNGEKVSLDDVKFPLEQIGKDLYCMVPDFYVNREDKNVGNIIKHTFFRTLSFVTVMYETLGDLVTGKASIEYLSGPVGTSTVIASAAKSGFMTLLSLVALISINLCVVNLLPLPALDGGRLVFMVIELIRGKPINQKYEAVIHFVGLLLLFALMILITFKDIFFPVI
jgi:regulator of sigma E protease